MCAGYEEILQISKHEWNNILAYLQYFLQLQKLFQNLLFLDKRFALR